MLKNETGPVPAVPLSLFFSPSAAPMSAALMQTLSSECVAGALRWRPFILRQSLSVQLCKFGNSFVAKTLVLGTVIQWCRLASGL